LAKITRKEMKSDKFALEVRYGVVRWGGIAAAVVVIVAAVMVYRNYQHAARQEALRAALEVQNAQVGPENPNVITFPTPADRDKAVNKVFGSLAAKYPGTEEGAIAEFFLGTNAADKGNLAEAEKRFRTALDYYSGPIASQVKLSLAQTYAAEGKQADAEKLVQSLIDHPAVLVSKEEATLVLAQIIRTKDPERARKLVDPLRSSPRSNVSKTAITAYGDISQK
jgi:predicted negative regulator of RcsB-dependent stress response